MNDSSLVRTPAASLIAVLALLQAASGIVRSVGWFEIGSDLVGRGVLLLPILGGMVMARGALIAGIALLYILFAWGTWNRRPWAYTFGLVAAVVNLLLGLSVLIQGEIIVRALIWCIVPVLIIYYLAAPNRQSV
jgi:hypothetical protein